MSITFFVTSFIVQHSLMWIIYHIEHPFFERYKVNNEPWPWNKDITEWRILLKRTLKFIGVNIFVVIPAVNYFDYVAQGYKSKHRIDVDGLPDNMTIFVSLVFCMIVEDFTFHWVHKLLHLPSLYPHIHKIHHEHKVTIGIV